MATVLVAFTESKGVSAPTTVGAGEFHTIIPRFENNRGVVAIEIQNADNEYQHVGFLTSRPSVNRSWQLQGPLTYRVTVKNAGADVDTGV